MVWQTYQSQNYKSNLVRVKQTSMNIHGLRDVQPGNANASEGNLRPARSNPGRGASMLDGIDPITAQNIKSAQLHRVLLISGNRQIKNPRQQSYFDMLSELCCPTYKCLSFSTLVMIATLIMYIVQLSLGLNKQGEFLEVKGETLIELGANYPPHIRSGQVYRLIAPIFLHVNFLHFFGNILIVFMFLTRIEHSFGPIRTFFLYILSGIGGNIFSAVCDYSTIKAGASTSLYGVIGVIFGYMIINWNGFNLIGSYLKCQLCCTSMTIILFIFFFSVIGTQNVDVYGHLGGFLTGLWLASINKTIIEQKYQKTARIIFFGLFIIQFLICFIVFYTK